MKQPKANQIVLALTAEQSRQIEDATGKFVTELQVEIVAVSAPLATVEPLAQTHNHSIQEGEPQ